MIGPGHGRLGIARQCSLVLISRSSFYYQGKGESPLNLSLMRLIDEQFLETPWTARARWRGTCGVTAAASGAAPRSLI